MKWVKLGDVAEINIGKTPARNNMNYWGGDNKWLSIADLESKYIYDTSEYITDLAVEETNIRQVPANTVVMSFKLSIGKVSITTEPIYTNEAIANFIPKMNVELDTEYLYYALQAIDYDIYVDRAAKGRTLNKRKLQNVLLPICNIERQKKIVDYLNQTSSIISTRQAQIKAMDELIQIVFYEIFDTINKELYSVLLDEIAIVKSSKRVYKSDYVDEGIPFYRSKEVIEKSKTIEPITELFITREHYEKLKELTGVPEKGDLLITAVGTIGEIWEVDTEEPFYFKDGNLIWVILDSKKTNSTFMKFLLKKLISDKVNQITSGSAYKALTIINLKCFEIPLPPLDLQNQFAEKVKTIEKEKAEMQKSLEEMQTLFNALMQKAFTGELIK